MKFILPFLCLIGIAPAASINWNSGGSTLDQQVGDSSSTRGTGGVRFGVVHPSGGASGNTSMSCGYSYKICTAAARGIQGASANASVASGGASVDTVTYEGTEDILITIRMSADADALSFRSIVSVGGSASANATVSTSIPDGSESLVTLVSGEAGVTSETLGGTNNSLSRRQLVTYQMSPGGKLTFSQSARSSATAGASRRGSSQGGSSAVASLLVKSITNLAGVPLGVTLTSESGRDYRGLVAPFDYLPWTFLHFMTEEGSEPEADPDGDGWSNKLEYLLQTDPLDRASVFSPKVELVSGSPQLVLPALSSQIRYRMSRSETGVELGDFMEVLVEEPEEDIDGPVVISLPESASKRAFFRVLAEEK